jgi:hypothetical protein
MGNIFDGSAEHTGRQRNSGERVVHDGLGQFPRSSGVLR